MGNPERILSQNEAINAINIEDAGETIKKAAEKKIITTIDSTIPKTPEEIQRQREERKRAQIAEFKRTERKRKRNEEIARAKEVALAEQYARMAEQRKETQSALANLDFTQTQPRLTPILSEKEILQQEENTKKMKEMNLHPGHYLVATKKPIIKEDKSFLKRLLGKK